MKTVCHCHALWRFFDIFLAEADLLRSAVSRIGARSAWPWPVLLVNVVGSLVAGVPAKVRRPLTPEERDGLIANAEIYLGHQRTVLPAALYILAQTREPQPANFCLSTQKSSPWGSFFFYFSKHFVDFRLVK